jgi:protein-S-isoprenylcysteine O-methyltransferase Ste14
MRPVSKPHELGGPSPPLNVRGGRGALIRVGGNSLFIYNRNMKPLESAGLTALVFLSFAFIHSLCVTAFIKNLMRKFLGDSFVMAFYRLLYTIFSAVTVSAAIYIINEIPDITLFHGPLWFNILFHLIQISGFLFGLLSFRDIDFWEFIGIRQAWIYAFRRESEGDAEGIRQYLVKTGVYSILRHPLYIAGIIIFTFNPYITVNRLVISILADMYFIYGAHIEERRMVERFGDEYREYMKRVPRWGVKIIEMPPSHRNRL